ncbi:hypothetical protein OY671_007561, partial [Metschnikowia pulcherrima]
AFEAVIDRQLFDRAAAVIAARSQRLSDDEMLTSLRQSFGDMGMLSGLVIDEQEGLPSSSAYRNRFGSLLRAYASVGYRPRRDYRYVEINRASRRRHPEMVEMVAGGLREAGGDVRHDETSDMLWVNDEFSVSVVIARCRQTAAGARRWRSRFDTGSSPDITVVVRMDTGNEHPLDFYLSSRIDVSSERLRLADENGLIFDAYRYRDLASLFSFSPQTSIREAA